MAQNHALLITFVPITALTWPPPSRGHRPHVATALIWSDGSIHALLLTFVPIIVIDSDFVYDDENGVKYAQVRPDILLSYMSVPTDAQVGTLM